MKKTMSYSKMARRFVALTGEIARDFGVLVTFLSHPLIIYWWWCYGFPVMRETLVFASLTFVLSVMGMVLGGIFYWTRQAFRKNRLLEYIFLALYATSGQMSIAEFVRSHRTAADYHSETKHPSGEEDDYDISDITGNELVMLYEKYVLQINILFCVIVPTWTTMAWGESLQCAVVWQALRYILLTYLHVISKSVARIPDYDDLIFILKMST